MGVRQLKKEILELLSHKDFEKSLGKIRKLPARKAVNPLFSFFYNSDELVKWRAVAAMGAVVSNLADYDMESARVIMRRLMWNLNDESGGIGWGSPEAMGEIMARHGRLAGEYHKILVSYIMPDGNYLEHEILQRGVLWGVGRLAHARSEDANLRGLAAWTAGLFDCKTTRILLKRLENDQATLTIYLNGKLEEFTVAQLALMRKRLVQVE
ncbi:MAG: HEAT repeat domain-containing protein [Deltaproteobacteria bacterium]|nr:HEAT repeat domain-containing protein [Deltaproteobacteria bacterium]